MSSVLEWLGFAKPITSRPATGTSVTACCGGAIEQHSGVMASYPRCAICRSRVG